MPPRTHIQLRRRSPQRYGCLISASVLRVAAATGSNMTWVVRRDSAGSVQLERNVTARPRAPNRQLSKTGQDGDAATRAHAGQPVCSGDNSVIRCRSVSTKSNSDSFASTASLPARELSASSTEKRIEFSNHRPAAPSRILILKIAGSPARNTWLN